MSTDDEKIIEQLKKDFVDEVSFYLEQCEESYLRLEQPELRTEEIGNLFRYAHSIKGSGSALGYTDFANFAHLVEDCLSLLRDDPTLIEPGIVSLLLKTTDALKEKIENIRNDDEAPWIVDELSQELKNAIHEIETNPHGMAKQPDSSIQHKNETVKAEAESESKTESKGELSPAASQNTEPSKVEIPDIEIDVNDPRFAPNPTTNLMGELNATVRSSLENIKDQNSSKPQAESESKGEGTIWQDLADETQKHLSTTETPASKNREQSQSNSASTVKIDTERIDVILNIVGELVVIKSQLMNQASKYVTDLKLNSVVSLMDKTVRDLQDRTLTMRMTPLKSLFLKLQRTARDLSLKLKKPVDFKVSGEETEIDRNMVELLSDPLLHICRNSIDHGIEPPDTRKAKGKSERGLVHLSARQTGGRVIIEVKDDGGGLNFDKIIEKAKKVGLLSEGQDRSTLSEKELTYLIFEPGFSTAEAVTDVSGRGVGMDVVRANIERLKGTIDVATEAGRGTSLILSLPLTTSITDGMHVEIGQRSFIIPMNAIHELVNAGQASSIQLHVGQQVMNHRGKFLPILDLRQLLLNQEQLNPNLNLGLPNESYQATADDVVIIVETGTRFVALRLEKILGQVQVVLKSLSANFDSTRGISGATILGDGKVALVLDPIGLADYAVEIEKRRLEKKREKGLTQVA